MQFCSDHAWVASCHDLWCNRLNFSPLAIAAAARAAAGYGDMISDHFRGHCARATGQVRPATLTATAARRGAAVLSLILLTLNTGNVDRMVV